MPLFSSLFRKNPKPDFDAPVAPFEPFFAIGDIHGSYEQMDALLQRIDACHQGEKVITVGDYVDRGLRTADVLAWLKRLTELYPTEFHCLMGNHEDMLLQFIDRPKETGGRWLRHGGLQTLESYRLPFPHDDGFVETRDLLVDAMGADMIAWLRGLPTHWQSGNVIVTHAGADPNLAIGDQPRDAFLWGHPDFGVRHRRDGLWVAYGHKIVDVPSAANGLISLDTGAYATNRLTAAHIRPGDVRFLSSDVDP